MVLHEFLERPGLPHEVGMQSLAASQRMSMVSIPAGVFRLRAHEVPRVLAGKAGGGLIGFLCPVERWVLS